MSQPARISSEADANQTRASDPSASAWVSANAGTGKTEVLVRRCLRLFLAGARPESILCLTYTKTAAAAMQNRLLRDLAAWSTMPEADLRDVLRRLTGRDPGHAELQVARRLFAQTLEARGGLKIYTIHGFCERILQRFPLEADVTPHFTVLDELKQAELFGLAFDGVMARAAKDTGGMLARALDKITAVTSEDYFREVVKKLLEKRGELARMSEHHGKGDDWPEAERMALLRRFEVEDAEEEELIGALAAVMSDAALSSAIATFAAFIASGDSLKTDRETVASLEKAKESPSAQRAPILRELFLSEKGAPKKFYSKAFADAHPAIATALLDAQDQFAALSLTLAHLRVAEASGAALALADAIHADYESRKRAEAALDFDDLISRTRIMLSRSGAAAWVLYKIDGGVDHILVDEAQDTNPDQWSIIERLAEEFFAGQGAGARLRTLFAVGDEKQSIYSFQGANPARFAAVGGSFRTRARDAELAWNDVPLNLSFRSTEPVLQAVDRVFEKQTAAKGLTSDGGTPITHSAFRAGEAGLVELWEIEKEEKSDPAEPFEPWMETRGGASSVDAVCTRIAALIKHWLNSGEKLVSQGRDVRAGDILILVRRRDPFTTPMVRALKRAGVPVAGADRMRLMDQLVVEDLVALADVLLMPGDDLALAVVLKSPLFGLDDEALFDLGHGRRESLWQTLMTKAREDRRFEEAATRLTAWRARADYAPPYEFFLALLGEDGQEMRRRILNRLGPEAAEALDEFLDLALLHDREDAPSLQGFIDRLRTTNIEIKRDMEQERDEVRIMTVHGAKGLQAPIVFLPDTCAGPRPQNPQLLSMPRAGGAAGTVDHLIWPPAKHSTLDLLAGSKRALRDADQEEYHRLLYVAMTRAADRLYVCGWEGSRSRDKDCWYTLLRDGLAGILTETEGDGGRKVWRLENDSKVVAKNAEPESVANVEAALPRWASTPAPPERRPPQIIPSRLGVPVRGVEQDTSDQPPLGPRELAGDNRFSRGRLVHTLLQYLPSVADEGRERAARDFVAVRGRSLDEPTREEIVTESLAILRHPDFAPLFGPGSLGEVPLVAKLGEGEDAVELSGQIDRLAILGDGLLILDYKTNRPPPTELKDVAPGYIGQLAAYRRALREMFGTLPLRAAIVWTDGPKLMEIPSTLLDSAEASILAAGAQP